MTLHPTRRPDLLRWTLTVLVALVGALALSACQSSPHRVANPVALQDLNGNGPEAEAAAYVLRPGDSLDVRFFYNPELNEAVMIRPDGRISLQLVGEQQAAGLSPGELEQRLREAYSRDLKTPEVSVIVTNVPSYQVYVDGEVGAPGTVPIAGGMTVLQSVARAGGFGDSARRDEVVLIRRVPGEEPQVAVLNLDGAINGSDLSQDVRLQPYDVVYVPRTAIGNVNQFMAQYFRNNLPVPFSFGYSF